MDNLEKKWHKIHAKKIRKRESTRQERVRRRKIGLDIVRNKASSRVHMTVPIIMSLFENYDECVRFINEIKEQIFINNVFVFLDFSKCTKISTETCVVLAAEIDRCMRKVPESVFGSYPNHPEVYFLLNELGFYHLLDIRSSKPTFDDAPEVDVVRLQSGKDNPENLMRGIKELFYPPGQDVPKSPFSGKVYRALTEAMANAVEHAYPQSFLKLSEGACVPIWWRAGFKVNNENKVLMILYDQGAGIPNTLTINWQERLEELISILSRDPYDDEKLALAMEKGRTMTKIKGRGQGSYDMQQLIRESSDGALSIFSYRGKYVYFNDGNWQQENLSLCLEGTLVVWKVCLDTVGEN